MAIVVEYVIGDKKPFIVNRIVLDGSVLRLYGIYGGGADISIPMHTIVGFEIIS